MIKTIKDFFLFLLSFTLWILHDYDEVLLDNIYMKSYLMLTYSVMINNWKYVRMLNLHIIWMPSVLFHFPCQGSSLTDRKEFEKSSCWTALLNEKPTISTNNQVIWILWGKHCVSNKQLKFWFNILLKEFQFFRKTLYQKA